MFGMCFSIVNPAKLKNILKLQVLQGANMDAYDFWAVAENCCEPHGASLSREAKARSWRNLKSKFRSILSPEGACETKNES